MTVNLVQLREQVAQAYPVYAMPRGIQRSKYWHEWVLSNINRILSTTTFDSLRIIDLGAGGGIIPACLRLAGADVTCLDTWNEYREDSDGEGGAFGNREDLLNTFRNLGVKSVIHDLSVLPLPLPRRAFDVVLFFDVIEHIPNGIAVSSIVSEIMRMCRPGAAVIVTTPNQGMLRNRIKALLGLSIYPDLERWLYSSPYTGHVREFTFAELRVIFEHVGFKTIGQVSTDRMLWSHRKQADGTWQSGIPWSPLGAALACYSLVTALVPRWRHTFLSAFRLPT